jgi:hypothetical protein
LTLTGAHKRLGITREALADLVKSGEIPYFAIDGHDYIEEATVEAIASRAIEAAAEKIAEQRRAELRVHSALMTAVGQSSDKQIRQRTGHDDHLELGAYERPKRKKKTTQRRG